MLKKAQSQIITTVLIILLVLAAIVIVWQVVSTTVRGGAEQVETQSACLGLNLVIVSANNATGTNNIFVRRDPGAPDQLEVSAIVFVNGANNGTQIDNLKELDSDTDDVLGLSSDGDYIQVVGKLSGGTFCPLSPKTYVTSI